MDRPELLKTEEFVVCPNRGEPLFRADKEAQEMSAENNYLYGMSKNAESGSIEIFPMNGDTITIHGEKEALFFIQRLIECFQ